jgi:hypothetical protein
MISITFYLRCSLAAVDYTFALWNNSGIRAGSSFLFVKEKMV